MRTQLDETNKRRTQTMPKMQKLLMEQTKEEKRMEWEQQAKIIEIKKTKKTEYATIRPLDYNKHYKTASNTSLVLGVIAYIFNPAIPYSTPLLVIFFSAWIAMLYIDQRQMRDWYLNESISIGQNHAFNKGDIVTLKLGVYKE